MIHGITGNIMEERSQILMIWWLVGTYFCWRSVNLHNFSLILCKFTGNKYLDRKLSKFFKLQDDSVGWMFMFSC